jgi:hypothetical protein
MSETVEAKPKKKETVYTEVKMDDGREVKFPGDQKVKKSVVFDGEGDARAAAGVQFDFRNGKSISLALSELDAATREYSACHGLLQKVGDEWSGTKEIDDMVLEGEAIVERLKKGEWAVEREAGDSMAGASVVIKALMEATNKTQEQIKAFLDKKIETAKAAGQKLTRQALYASFRNPTSQVGKIIRRIEEEKAAKASVVDADATLGELMAEAETEGAGEQGGETQPA